MPAPAAKASNLPALFQPAQRLGREVPVSGELLLRNPVRQSMLASQGEVSVMWANPLAGTITTLALLLFWPLIGTAIGALWRR